MMMNDAQQLQQIVGRLAAAWNAADGPAWADEFAEDADFIHVLGGHYTGRGAIAEGHKVIFATIYRDSRYALDVEKIRWVTEDVAVVFTLSTLRLAGGEELRARPSLVARREAGRWRIVMLQNTLVDAGDGGARETLARHPYRPASPDGQAGAGSSTTAVP